MAKLGDAGRCRKFMNIEALSTCYFAELMAVLSQIGPSRKTLLCINAYQGYFEKKSCPVSEKTRNWLTLSIRYRRREFRDCANHL